MRSSKLLVYVLLSLLTIAVGVVTNIATSQIPTRIQPYLWLSWPILGVLALVFIALSVREALERDTPSPRVSKSVVDDQLGQQVHEVGRGEGSDEKQEIHFCTTNDGVRLAYATVGEGPPLVKTANWLSHLDFEWRIPFVRHWLGKVSEGHLLVRYDERGCGLSDRSVEDFSFEAWVRDLDSIVNELSLNRFSLLGISQGGAVAVAYAVQYPEKVRHLVLYGSFARGILKHDLTQSRIKQQEAFYALIERWWGRDNPAFRQIFTSLVIPEATKEQMALFNELARVSTSPENAVKFMREFGNIDIRELATKVEVPTLVLHCRDDKQVPFKEGRELATLIPVARFVPLEGKNHILVESDPAWQQSIDEIRRFMGMDALE
jgi:pimeloyl-ACP methyl ester carboxylesterase